MTLTGYILFLFVVRLPTKLKIISVIALLSFVDDPFNDVSSTRQRSANTKDEKSDRNLFQSKGSGCCLYVRIDETFFSSWLILCYSKIRKAVFPVSENSMIIN